jgi:hypothetical protein
MFYYQRYDNHNKAGLFAAKTREAAQRVRAGRGAGWPWSCC